VRSAVGLSAKISRRQHEFVPPQSDIVPNWRNLYQTISIPLHSSTLKRLHAAWQRLEVVHQWDSRTLIDVLIVLTESVAAFDSHPIIRVEPEPEYPKSTAAHPRAFRGTKYKPPKSKRPTPLNLQLALCNPTNQTIVLQKLWTHREKAIKPLCDMGYDSARVEFLLTRPTPPTEPGLFLRHPDVPLKLKPLPPAFREEILPLLIGLPWDCVETTLNLFWQLKLHEETELRSSVSRFLAQSKNINWLQHLAPRKLLLIFAIELNVARSPCPPGVEEVFSALEHFAAPPQWAYTVLCGLRDGISCSYLRDGIRLAGEFRPKYHFSYPPQSCQHFNYNIVEKVLLQVSENADLLAMDIWRAAAKLDGLCEVLAAVDTLSPEKMTHYLRWLLSIEKHWDLLKKHLLQIQSCLRSLSDVYVSQWVDDFNRFIEADNVVDIKDALTLAKRLAQPPFLTESYRELAFGHFIRIRGLRQRVLESPERSLRCIDKACRRENDANLIAWGLSSIINEDSAFAVDCLWHCPKKLVTTAKSLGPMSWALRREIVREFTRHPMMTVDFESLSLKKVYDTLQGMEVTRRSNPIPRTLRDYFEGKRTLSKGQLERHRRVLFEGLLKTKLQILAEIGEQALWRGFERSTNIPDAKHALQLFRDIFSNKRALRRFLKEYIKGNAEYLRDHPLTLKWAQHHPKIDLDIWTGGIQFENYEQAEYINVNLEQAPLEVLKLGTYVGSCLGLGGIMTDSAVAVMLDINKQVLYARDEKGVVLARQLIAISKEDKLVAFEVYPQSTPSRIKALFQAYDQHFANRLGINLLFSADEYEIESILSEYWWDDGAWDFDL